MSEFEKRLVEIGQEFDKSSKRVQANEDHLHRVLERKAEKLNHEATLLRSLLSAAIVPLLEKMKASPLTPSDATTLKPKGVTYCVSGLELHPDPKDERPYATTSLAWDLYSWQDEYETGSYYQHHISVAAVAGKFLGLRTAYYLIWSSRANYPEYWPPKSAIKVGLNDQRDIEDALLTLFQQELQEL